MPVRLMLLALLTLSVGFPPNARQASAPDSVLWVHISEGTSRAGLVAVAEPYATGGPWAGVPARGVGSQPATASSFRVRAWMEGARARVLVFAVTPRPDDSVSETQIGSFALAPGESRDIATEKYGARPVNVRVSDTPTKGLDNSRD